MSVAPEIAILAKAALLVPAQAATRQAGEHSGQGRQGERGTEQPTLGTLARQLRMLAATPERWWGLVRFVPARRGSTASGTGCAATARVTRSACTPAQGSHSHA